MDDHHPERNRRGQNSAYFLLWQFFLNNKWKMVFSRDRVCACPIHVRTATLRAERTQSFDSELRTTCAKQGLSLQNTTISHSPPLAIETLRLRLLKTSVSSYSKKSKSPLYFSKTKSLFMLMLRHKASATR